eukprot:m.13070 g.13070  ORF g.13070 m.13070 type:complete len:362 (+) comp24463_c0_seq2:83-1168(+)
MSGRGGKSRRKPVSRSARAGVQFPVSRLHRYLRQSITKRRISAVAPVYLAGVLEYLCAEVLELAGNAANDHKKRRIIPRHILLAIANDDELHELLKGVTISCGGVLPHILPQLLKRRTPQTFSARNPMSPAPPSPKSPAAVKPKSPKKAAKPKKAKKGKGKNPATPRKPGASAATINVLSEKKLFLGQKLIVVQGDLATMTADAVIHPTNSQMSLGGQVGGSLSAAGGAALQQAVTDCQQSHGSLKETEAAISDAPNLSASHVIHVHSPSWGSANARGQLETTVKNALALAENKNLKTLAFPSVGSGGNGFPKHTAAQIILKTIKNYFMAVMSSSLKEVYFVLYDSESIDVYTHELSKMDD